MKKGEVTNVVGINNWIYYWHYRANVVAISRAFLPRDVLTDHTSAIDFLTRSQLPLVVARSMSNVC